MFCDQCFLFSVSVSCCVVRYDFRKRRMFGTSLPQGVCKRVHVLYMSFGFIFVQWCPAFCPIICLYNFRIKMFGSSLPSVVCRRAHVLFILFLYHSDMRNVAHAYTSRIPEIKPEILYCSLFAVLCVLFCLSPSYVVCTQCLRIVNSWLAFGFLSCYSTFGFMCIVCISLFVLNCPFCFGHYVVCSSIFGF